jgi:hypothetical protein
VDTMLGTVVGQGYGRLAGEGRSVGTDSGDTAGDALRVFHGDPIAGVSEALGRRPSAPLGGGARPLVNQEISSADDAGDFDPRTRAEVTAAPSGVGESG